MKKEWLHYAAAVTLVLGLIAPGPINAFVTRSVSGLYRNLFLADTSQIQLPLTVTTIKDRLQSRGIYFGTYFNYYDVTQAAPRPSNYLTEMSKYFNVYTVPSFWANTERTQGVFDYSTIDKVTDFAIANGAKTRLHNLVWYQILPTWLTSGTFTPDQLSAILKNHVQSLVTHYAQKYPGEAIAIDAVNEPICDNTETNCPSGVKNVLWSAVHKPDSTDPTDYIALAFQWAHEADPTAKLYLNENGIEYPNQKMDRLYAVVKKLVDQGVPIDGIGFQSHVSTVWPYDQQGLTDNMNRFATLGLTSQITEMDVVAPVFGDGTALALPSADDTAQQSKIYSQFLAACVAATKCNAFVVWGAYDPGSWTYNYSPFNFAVFSTSVSLTAGTHAIGFAYTNDGTEANGTDRNLYINGSVLIPQDTSLSAITMPIGSMIPSAGPILFDPAKAMWSMFSNGSIYQNVTVPADGTYQIRVNARATGLASMDITVDKKAVSTTIVNSSATPFFQPVYPDLFDDSLHPKVALNDLVSKVSSLIAAPIIQDQSNDTPPPTDTNSSSGSGASGGGTTTIITDTIPPVTTPEDPIVVAPQVVTAPLSVASVTSSIASSISNLIPSLPTGTWSFVPIIKNIVSPVKQAPAVVPTTPVPATVDPKKDYSVMKAEYVLNGTVVHSTSSFPDGWQLDTATLADGTYTLETKFYYADGTTDGSSSTFTVDNTPTILEKIISYVQGLLKK